MSDQLSRRIYDSITQDDEVLIERLFTEKPSLLNELPLLGQSWLCIAAAKNSPRVVQTLLGLGIEMRDDPALVSPLGEACRKQASDCVEILLSHNATLSGNTTSGRPLVEAIATGNIGLVKRLLEAGAEVNFTRGELKFSPITFGESFGHSHKPIVELLLAHGAVDPEAENTSPGDDSSLLGFVTNTYGKPATNAFQEIVSDLPVSILVIPGESNAYTKRLVTNGLSSHASPLPNSVEDDVFSRVELVSEFPGTWIDHHSGERLASGEWLVDWIRGIAHQIVSHDIVIEGFAIFSNGDPPAPRGESTELSCILVVRFPDDPVAFASTDTPVAYYQMIPISREERDLIYRDGINAFIERMMDADIPPMAASERQNVGV
ncbi:MAG: suppressor of fused domain protein [Planctomycetota bacterium]